MIQRLHQTQLLSQKGKGDIEEEKTEFCNSFSKTARKEDECFVPFSVSSLVRNPIPFQTVADALTLKSLSIALNTKKRRENIKNAENEFNDYLNCF